VATNHLNKDDLDDMNSEDHSKTIQETPLLLVYFSYPQCQVCKVLKPKVQELLTDFPQFEFLYIDINRHPIFRGEYLVFAVPTIVLFQNGREMQRFSRHVSVQELEEYLARIT
jgi:thioredoxin-like negative regulator of GroEL